MQINVYLLAAGFLILCNNYDSISGSPIHGVNVRFADPGEFPYVVSIKRSNDTNPQPETDHVCSGVLVTHKDVLSTESCLLCFFNEMPEIMVGSNNIREGTKHYVLWWLTYNQWNNIRQARRAILNSVIILRLNETVDYDIRPIETVSIPQGVLRHLRGQVPAFGREIRDHISNWMETADLTVMTKRECEHRFARQYLDFRVTENFFCAIANPVALMSKGNRGAPLVQNGRLIGIYKELYPDIPEEYHPSKVNLFMFVSFFIDFILDINVYLLAAGFLILCNNYDSISGSPIHGVNVRFADPGEFPYVVSIKRFNPANPQPETDHVCTGVLISHKDVLTAESCLNSFLNQVPEVIVGSNNIREGSKHYVLWWLTYREWCRQRGRFHRFSINDVSILRLNESVSINIQPIEIAIMPDAALNGLIVHVVAFGRRIRDHISNLMETVIMKIVARRSCERRITRESHPFPITPNLICVVANPIAIMHDVSII
ncbi:PREDICTED: uncharacterized protein LOC105360363 [Ceratosolen solmsi marchali]|uniref:Uncharacterized protein LOC105360363 n=1 Tax=Ceratosolen solmsi marchali TaxID=326594 RepID=A0AAJ6YCM6_9HYME|nr:PREDICTED: uncharacterized protein LOC105360363 [Ceratosolen solmsi marchali]